MKLFLSAWLMACVVLPAHGFENTLAERTRACTACHGEQGKAGPDGYYPRLAGKPAGYLYNQLHNFKQGRRHYDLMARLIEPLSDAYLQDMAQYFSALKVPYPAPALQAGSVAPAVLARGRVLAREGDASKGLPACVACHGDKLTGVAPAVPGLLGLPLDYLNGQLGAWQSGQRRAHAPDCMAQVVRRLTSEDVMAVANYLARQVLPSDPAPAAAAQGDVRAKLVSTSDTWRCGSAPLAKGQP